MNPDFTKTLNTTCSTKSIMKKQAFSNGGIKEPVDKFVEMLELTTSVVDFYKHKDKILEHLRGTRE